MPVPRVCDSNGLELPDRDLGVSRFWLYSCADDGILKITFCQPGKPDPGTTLQY
jgi:hypothetical protein